MNVSLKLCQLHFNVILGRKCVLTYCSGITVQWLEGGYFVHTLSLTVHSATPVLCQPIECLSFFVCSTRTGVKSHILFLKDCAKTGELKKNIPITGLWDPEGSGRLMLPDSVTSALEGGRLSASRIGCLYPQEYPGTHFKRLSRPRAHWIAGFHGKNLHWHHWGSIPGPSD
jgi:hypothetical protein